MSLYPSTNGDLFRLPAFLALDDYRHTSFRFVELDGNEQFDRITAEALDDEISERTFGMRPFRLTVLAAHEPSGGVHAATITIIKHAMIMLEYCDAVGNLKLEALVSDQASSALQVAKLARIVLKLDRSCS